MSSFVDWLQQETAGLLVLCALAIAVLLVLIIRFKLEPFVALLVSGLLLALAAGLSIGELVGTPLKSADSVLETGYGGVLGHIAVIVGLGTVLGSMLERSGGADVLTARLLGVFGERRAPLVMGIVGLVIGIPVFFDIGVFVLAPLIYVAARRGGRSLLFYALPVLAALSMTHAFLPPHPGPTAAAGLLGVPLGYLIPFGLLCGLPAFAVAGLAWPLYIGRRINISLPDNALTATHDGGSEDGAPQDDGDGGEEGRNRPVSLGLVLVVILLPLLLILGATFGTVILDKGPLLSILVFLGTPAVALVIAVLLAYWLLCRRQGMTPDEILAFTSDSLKPLAMILLVVGGGAFFGKVISATGVGDALAASLQGAGLPVLALAYVISVGLRLAQGSATVALVTTGGIVANVTDGRDYSTAQLAVIAIAIAAGSIFASHVNDGGFWIISRYFNMTVKETLLTWTVLESILSVVGFAMVCLVWLFL